MPGRKIAQGFKPAWDWKSQIVARPGLEIPDERVDEPRIRDTQAEMKKANLT